ncbi:hypothetical protein TNCV_4125251 [Trichonephila clavipes]|nr:hypothetical protein TNCV_4125251 [Trichonephila clavipes]
MSSNGLLSLPSLWSPEGSGRLPYAQVASGAWEEESAEDDEHSGFPQTSWTPENIEKVSAGTKYESVTHPSRGTTSPGFVQSTPIYVPVITPHLFSAHSKIVAPSRNLGNTGNNLN